MPIDFVFDYLSPYSYLADSQLKTLETSVNFKPVDIVAVMKLVSNQPSPLCPPKARYAGLDAARWAKHYGVPFALNRPLFGALRAGEFESSLLVRAGLAAQQLGVFDQVHKALFNAVWAGDGDVVTEEGRKALIGKLQIGSVDIWSLASESSIGELLAQNNQGAAARGVFGAPSIFVGEEMYFGNDRLEFVREHLKAIAANEGKIS